jgi:HEAT repeat protein
MLARVAASQGALSQYAVAALGRMKAESTIPLLRELLKDETLWLVSPHPYGGARYPIREAAVEALREIGQAVTGVKTTLSPETRPRSG